MERRAFITSLAGLSGLSLLSPVLGPISGAEALSSNTIEERIARQVLRAPLPGLAVGVVDGENLTYGAGFGFADVARRVVPTVDTPFLLASVSKLVTGVTALVAAEEGKLSLDADVQSYLPFPMRHDGYRNLPITVRMLMTHTSGIRDNYDVTNGLYTVGDPVSSLQSFLRAYLVPGGEYFDSAKNFYPSVSPGTAYHYSNTGIALLGLVVEGAVGMPFDTYSSLRIFSPLGMTRTSWKLAGLPVSDVAVPYTVRTKPRIRFVPKAQYGFPDYPNGLLRSTVADLAKFTGMLINGGSLGGVRTLSPGSIALMESPAVPDIDESQGLVGYYEATRSGTLFGHSGSETGVATRLFYSRERRRGVIVLVNADEDYRPVTSVMNRVEGLLFQHD